MAFLSINPLKTGHTLVVPIAPIDHWLDLDVDLAEHLMGVAHTIGRAQMAAFSPARVGLIVAGMEVPHCHLHVVPIDFESDLSFTNANPEATAASLAAAAAALQAALDSDG